MTAHLLCERGDRCINRSHDLQNHVNDSLIADRSIDHGVVNGAIRPFDVKIFLNEINTLAINCVHEELGVFVALAASQQTSNFTLPRGIKKNAQRIFAVLEELLRSSSHDYRVAGLCHVLNDLFRKLQNAFAVDQLELVRIDAAFITTAQE